jgi:hypothetical protein
MSCLPGSIQASACNSQDVELPLKFEGCTRNAKSQNGIICNQPAKAAAER